MVIWCWVEMVLIGFLFDRFLIGLYVFFFFFLFINFLIERFCEGLIISLQPLRPNYKSTLLSLHPRQLVDNLFTYCWQHYISIFYLKFKKCKANVKRTVKWCKANKKRTKSEQKANISQFFPFSKNFEKIFFSIF